MTNTVGFVATIDAQALQERINAKAADLPKYRHHVAEAHLLIVADGSTASGFLEVRPGIVVDAAGFDAVYFQRYPFDDTRLIATGQRT
jgi:hypothetical protein